MGTDDPVTDKSCRESALSQAVCGNELGELQADLRLIPCLSKHGFAPVMHVFEHDPGKIPELPQTDLRSAPGQVLPLADHIRRHGSRAL